MNVYLKEHLSHPLTHFNFGRLPSGLGTTNPVRKYLHFFFHSFIYWRFFYYENWLLKIEENNTLRYNLYFKNLFRWYFLEILNLNKNIKQFKRKQKHLNKNKAYFTIYTP